MDRFCRTITTAVLGLALVAGLGACTPDSQEPPLPTASQSPESVLDPGCPTLLPGAVKAVRIQQGNPEEAIASVLNSYSSWVNAGTDILQGWVDTEGTVPDECVEGLAEQGRIAYSETIFTTQTDVAWQDYYAGQQELTA